MVMADSLMHAAGPQGVSLHVIRFLRKSLGTSSGGSVDPALFCSPHQMCSMAKQAIIPQFDEHAFW